MTQRNRYEKTGFTFNSILVCVCVVSLHAQQQSPIPVDDFDVFVWDDPDPNGAQTFENCSRIPLTLGIIPPPAGGTIEVCIAFPTSGATVGYFDISDLNGFSLDQIGPGNRATYCQTLTFSSYDPNEEDPIAFPTLYVVPQNAANFSGVVQNIVFTATVDGITTVIGTESRGFQDNDIPYNFPNGVALSQITGTSDTRLFQPPSTSATTEVQIVFDGILNVDIDYELGNEVGQTRKSSLHLGPNTVVNVLDGSHLTLNEVIVDGCDQMYEAIVVKSGGKLTVKKSNIVDGIHAITVENGGELYIEDSDLFNNYVSVYVPSSTTGETDQFPTVTILGSNFYQEGPENFGGNVFDNRLLPPYAGERGFAAAEFNDVAGGITIAALPPVGNQPLKKSVFGYLENGLVFNRSAGVISGSDFEFIYETANTPSGNGIITRDNGNKFVYSNRVRVTSTYLQVGTTFDNMRTAIRAEDNIRLEVNDATITNVDYGVLGTNLGDLYFNDNSVESFRSGIEANGRIIAQLARIDRNDFTVKSRLEGNVSTQGAGIRLNDLGNPTGSFRVRDNTFTIDGGTFGIVGNNALRLFADEGNSIGWATDPLNTFGVQLTGGLIPRIEEFLIRYDNPNETAGFTEATGIDLRNTASPRIGCNTIDGLETGVSFFGSNQITRLRGNKFQEAAVGLQLGINLPNLPATIIGQQIHTGNMFEGPFQSFDAKYETDIILIPNNNFLVFNDPGENYVPNIVNVSGWFQEVINNPENTFNCPSGLPPGLTETELELSLVEYDNDDYSAGFWLPNRQLYAQYLESGITPTSGGGLDSWVTTIENTEIDEFQSVENQISAIGNIDPTQMQYFESQWADIYAEQDAYLTATLAQYPSDPDNAQLQASRENSLASAQSQQANVTLTGKQVAIAMSNKIAQANGLNDALATDSIFQQNTVIINGLVLDYISGGKTAIAGQEPVIYGIAAQCPHHGGKDVYTARSLLAVLGDQTVFDDLSLCSPNPSLRPMENEFTTTSSISVFPNPTSELLNIQHPSGIKSVQLFDALGRLVLEENQVSDLMVKLNVANLVPGIYTVRLTDKEDQTTVHKVTVQ